MAAPKLFISYCWSNPTHEQWVITLATELCESGVDVILDKWDLKVGNDAIAFMEKMVTDKEINKVAIICDEKYAIRADGRSGGVGTETQIISKEIYDNEVQEKFVAIIAEKDSNGKPFLPTYYKSRIYIDLSENDKYTDNFDRLLRWIFDKPVNIKPEIGNIPTYLTDEGQISLGSSALFKKCIDAIKNTKPTALGVFDEYCSLISAKYEYFRISNLKGEFDEAVIQSINEFIPIRNEIINLLFCIARYTTDIEYVRRIHRLFEELLPYNSRPPQISQYREWDFDNFKFITHELFLYTLAVLIKYERFAECNVLFQEQYYFQTSGNSIMSDFTIIREFLHSLEYRNNRLKLNRISLHSDLLRERCSGIGIEFQYLMQADFVALMRSEIESKDRLDRWWPDTLVFLGRSNNPFEIFARSVSKTYFDKVKLLLSINEPNDLQPLLISLKEGSRKLPRLDIYPINPYILLGFDSLCTRL